MAGDAMHSRINIDGVTILKGKRDSAYALVPLDRSRMTIMGNTDDMLKVADLRKTIKGEFIWFAERDKSYVIEDPVLVAQAFAAWAPVQKIDAQMKAQGDKMEAQGKLMEAAAEKIRVNLEANGALRDVEQRGREIGRVAARHETIARRLEQVALESAALPASDTDKRAVLDARRTQLQAQLAPLTREMDAQQLGIAAQSAKAGQDMGQALGRRMAELSKPMGEMGRTMGDLGRQRAQAQRQAEQATQAVFQQALGSGKAVAATPSA